VSSQPHPALFSHRRHLAHDENSGFPVAVLQRNQGRHRLANWDRQTAPSRSDPLQISVERRQFETTSAIRVQRPCSAEALAKVASAIAIVGCVEIADRFKACRPD
jgi:hypothetical protein